MKRMIPLLLCALLVSALFTSSTAFGQNIEDFDFTHMTPEAQYAYLQTLSVEEIDALLATLNEEQLAALKAYEDSLEAEPPAETLAPEETGEGDEASADTKSFAEMTPEEQYEYLQTLASDEAAEAALATLTEEQLAALEAYAQSLDESDGGDTPKTIPAVNYTHAGPFLAPVEVPARMKAGALAMRTVGGGEEDALELYKTLSGSDGDYLLTIEAYATGEVSIVTGETAVPADIILVLDASWSMDYDFVSGYASVSFSRNSQAYTDRANLYVKDTGNYYPVSISRTNTSQGYRYTYTYTAGGTPHTYTSDNNAANDPPPNWDFYHPSTVSRLAALKTAANAFIDSIEAKANAEDGVDHRIAVVTFSSSASIISGNHAAGGAFVDAHDNVGGINTLQTAISGLATSGATRADLGLGAAVNIFQQDPPDTGGLHNRVVVFFTDGSPSSSSGSFESSVANPAIASANTLKKPVAASGYGATVYTIGIFDGADPTAPVGGASNENKFMHYVSSNYPNAMNMTNPGSGSNEVYYLSASDTTGLGEIFTTISENIETGGTAVTLDESAVMKDIITPYFSLPAGAGPGDIHLYTSEVDTATGAWQPRVPFSGPVSISTDRKTVGVSGFDYSGNYYAAIETNGVITGYRGKKLIIEIPIDYVQGSCFGGTVPTNEPPSGIYEEDILVKALPIPTVDIPVNYDFTPRDKPIYITQSASVADLFTTAAGYVANGVNNAYVDIVYTVKAPGGAALGIYTIPAGAVNGSWNTGSLTVDGLTANTAYTVSCTVTPVSGPVSPATIAKHPTVYVWKPELTFQDSVIYLGQSADYGDNFVSEVWKNSSASAPFPAGQAPALAYTYTPAAGVFTDDTHVAAAVRIGGTDITGHTGFVHAPCGYPGCGFDPARGRFMVHVKMCSLVIAKEGAADPTDTFVFRITGGGLALRVSVQGNESATITGLPAGSYTVAEDADWSWRYTAGSEYITLSGEHPSGQVSIENQVTNDKWLGGDSRAANLFSAED